MGYDTCCNTSLTLGLVTDQDLPRNHTNLIDDHREDQKKPTYSSLLLVDKFDHNQSFPSLMLGLSSSSAINDQPELNRQASSVSGVSSFSNSSVKRERDGVSAISGEEVEVEKVASKVIRSSFDDQEIEEGGARKKLRLSKEQSLVLEESFKEHSTLNPKQKQALAKRLNLRPRQVEVWFQNRRARTKLKQNELDCELLKKCCEALTDDNRRLQREIQELKAAKMAAPPAPTAVSSSLYMQFPAATLTMCPSCERISGNVGDKSSKSPLFSLGTHRFGPFSSHPSAAC